MTGYSQAVATPPISAGARAPSSNFSPLGGGLPTSLDAEDAGRPVAVIDDGLHVHESLAWCALRHGVADVLMASGTGPALSTGRGAGNVDERRDRGLPAHSFPGLLRQKIRAVRPASEAAVA